MRPRKHDRHLPACVYFRHGAYWLVKRGKWTRLGSHLAPALAEYAKLTEAPQGGMDALITAAMPSILAGRSASTVKQYTHAAERLRYMLADFAPHQISHAVIYELRDKLPGAYSVANRTVTVLSLVMDYAAKQQIIENNPCVGIKRLKQHSRTRRLTMAEFAAIRAVARPRHQAVMDLCYLTGQRIGDVLTIRRTDCGPDGIGFAQQKTGKRLVVAWTAELRAAVEAAKALHGPVQSLWLLKGIDGEPMSYTVAWKDWRAARKLAGVLDANIHDLRAMSGTEADAQGKDARSLLGHTDERTTRIYLRDRVVPVVDGPSLKPPSIGQSKKTRRES